MHIQNIRIRDPFVIPLDNIYYLLGTTGDDPWQGSSMMLYRSADLLEFEEVGCMLSPEDMQKYPIIWAPELHVFNGKYYLFITYLPAGGERECAVFFSDSITDFFLPLTGESITPKGWGCLDASFVQWKGKPYLFFTNEWTTPITGDGDGAIYVCELSDDLTQLVGKPRKIISGKYCGFSKMLTHSNGVTGYVAEGAYAVREGEGISLYWSTFTTEGYCVVKSRAEDILGEYQFDRFVFKNNGGHSMVFTDFSGRQNITFHHPNKGPLERMTYLEL